MKLVTQIARLLVDSPQDVRVNAIEGDHTTVLALCIAKEDIVAPARKVFNVMESRLFKFQERRHEGGVKSSGRVKYFFIYDDAAIRFEEIK
jgi:hypothetical protein